MPFYLMASILNFALRVAKPCIERLIASSDVLFTLFWEGMLLKLCWCAYSLLLMLNTQFHTAWHWRTVERTDFKLTGDLVTVFIWRQARFPREFIMVQCSVLCFYPCFYIFQNWRVEISRSNLLLSVASCLV